MCRQVNDLDEKVANLSHTLIDLESRLIRTLNIREETMASRFSLMMSEEVRNLSALVAAEKEILESNISFLTSTTTSLLTVSSIRNAQLTQLQMDGKTRGVEIKRQAEGLNKTMEDLRRQQDQLNSLKREHGLVIESIRAHACFCTKVFTPNHAEAAKICKLKIFSHLERLAFKNMQTVAIKQKVCSQRPKRILNMNGAATLQKTDRGCNEVSAIRSFTAQWQIANCSHV